MIARIRIAGRLGILVAVMALFLLAVAGVGMRGMSSIAAGLKTVYEDRTEPLVQLGTIERGLFKIRVRVLKMLEQEKINEPLMAEIRAVETTIGKEWKDYSTTYMDAEEKALAGKVENGIAAYLAAKDEVLRLLAAGEMEKGRALANGETLQRFLAADDLVVQDIDLQARVAKQEY
ncbi:MAG TPA: MCP four helix bundle domain-containing protein, partial [Magnetospirillum sp.]|nr:MCP four helix bundle domain-containing protein [Magnetospirillum sp.]